MPLKIRDLAHCAELESKGILVCNKTKIFKGITATFEGINAIGMNADNTTWSNSVVNGEWSIPDAEEPFIGTHEVGDPSERNKHQKNCDDNGHVWGDGQCVMCRELKPKQKRKEVFRIVDDLGFRLGGDFKIYTQAEDVLKFSQTIHSKSDLKIEK